jgi:hypothetical protein
MDYCLIGKAPPLKDGVYSVDREGEAVDQRRAGWKAQVVNGQGQGWGGGD